MFVPVCECKGSAFFLECQSFWLIFLLFFAKIMLICTKSGVKTSVFIPIHTVYRDEDTDILFLL